MSIANSRGIEGVQKLAKEIGAEAKDYESISKNADVLIISIPFGVVPKLPKNIFNDLPKSSIIVDTMNYYPEIRKENFDESKPESIWISELVGRKVIKTFNSVLAYSLENLGKAKEEKNRLAMQIAGDDEEQKKVKQQLAEQDLANYRMHCLRQAEHEQKLAQLKGQNMDINFGSQIRSYVLQPYKMVKDLRTEAETSDTKAVLDGDIDIFLAAALAERIGNDEKNS